MDALKDLSVSVIYDTNQRAEEDISLRNSLHHASEGNISLFKISEKY